MNQLEDLLRSTLREHEDQAPDAAGLGPAVRRRAGLRRRRERLAGVAAAACVLAVIGGVAALRPSGSPKPVVPAPSVPAPSVPAPLPAGSQAVSFRGVEVLVPAAWKLNDGRCNTPLHDTVDFNDGSPGLACLISQPAGLTVVRFSPTEFGTEVARHAKSEVLVGGTPARRGSFADRTNSGERVTTVVLVLPGQGVVLTVSSPDQARAGRILDTVRLAPVDHNGCADRIKPLTSHDYGSAGTAGAFVPAGPSSATICRYRDERMYRSVRLDPAGTAKLAEVLNGLAPGVLRDPSPPSDCAQEPRRGFVVRFGYPSGPVVSVVVRIDSCADLVVDNGNRTVVPDWPLVDLLGRAVGYDGSLPMTLEPGK